MIRFSTFAALAALASVALGSPTPLATLNTVDGDKVANSYIVQLKKGTDKSNSIGWLGKQHPNASAIKYSDWDSDILHGFAVHLQPEAVQALRAFPDIESISEDGIASASALTSQSGAPWGLDRISHNARPQNQNSFQLAFNYRYDSSAGRGVDIYIIDSGINLQHVDYRDRLRPGAMFGPYQSPNDDNGHGSHVAGTAAGTLSGVAKGANLIPVKVLGANGKGPYSDIISGVNYVFNASRSTGRPSVACMSLGGGAYAPIDNAVNSLVNGGVHVAVAAGNDNIDSSNVSPARAAGPMTVGASNVADAKASFSNFGAPVDIWAPGENVFSAWIGSPQASNIISGTSMAAPHVAGYMAYTIGRLGNTTPPNLKNFIQQTSQKNVISGIPVGTINALLRNEITG